MKWTALLALLIVLALPLGMARAASAPDAAPPPPPAGASIYPDVETTQVRMMAETVMINVEQNEPGTPSTARVVATFIMRNLGSQEEKLAVRFPLNFLFPGYMSDWEQCEYSLPFPEINDFTALVDGATAEVTKIGGPGEKKGASAVACWASFPVNFPQGKDVILEARYTVRGYPGVSGSDVYEQFNYVLASGRAWKDTIGSVDIILNAPYPLNNRNLLSYSPENGAQAGSEIRWHFENFEPDPDINAPGGSINTALMDPGHWKRINESVRAVTEAPQDGAAWGKLAQAYQQAAQMIDGWRKDEGGYELFAQSASAYAKAVALRPGDADLHYGYASLLIGNAIFPTFGRPEDIEAGLVRGVEQLKRALEINPNHPRARALLQQLAEWPNAPRKIVDVSSPQPNYLILTPGGATFTPIPSLTRTPFPPSLTPTATWTPHPTRTPTVTSTPTLTFTPLATRLAAETIRDTQSAPPPGPGKPAPGLCGAVLLPGTAAVIWTARKRMHSIWSYR